MGMNLIETVSLNKRFELMLNWIVFLAAINYTWLVGFKYMEHFLLNKTNVYVSNSIRTELYL